MKSPTSSMVGTLCRGLSLSATRVATSLRGLWLRHGAWRGGLN